jgi:hypothetical protein
MTNRFSVVVGVVVGVVTGVAVDLRLRQWKHDAVAIALLPARDLVSGDGNLCLQLHTVLRCFSNPGVATPSDGALRRHPHTPTAVTTKSGIEDAGGERGLCV